MKRRLVQIHGHQELRVARDLLEASLQQLDSLHRVHIRQHAPQPVHQLQLLRIQQQLFAAGAGAVDVDRGVNAAEWPLF